MSETALKPCPFCGSRKETLRFGTYFTGSLRGFDYVSCNKCFAEIRAPHKLNSNAAVEAWNKRAEGVNNE